MQENTLISDLLSERNNFIIIGLTGRTGSGCSTASKLLTEEQLTFPLENQVNIGNESFFQGLDKERYKLVKDYIENNHYPFTLIKVSELITTKLLEMEVDSFRELLEKKIDNHYQSKIEESGIITLFSNLKKEFSSKFDKIQKYVCGEQNDDLISLNLEEWLNFIQKATSDIKQILKDKFGNCYVNIYQHIGDSLRKTQKIYSNFEEKKFDPQGLHILPQMINKVIKIHRAKNEKKQSECYIVIDAIRNPYEAKFFKDRYSAFYLISINAPTTDRRKYLQDKYKFSVQQIEDVDKKETGYGVKGLEELIIPNVKKCIEISDIHIFNPRNEPNNHNILKAQLAWYLSLIKHPGLITPTSLERVMQIAYTAKLNSGCISRQVGAVVTDANYSIKAVGWNDVAKGQVPCNLRSLKGVTNFTSDTTYSEYERHSEKFQKVANERLIKLKDIKPGKNLAYCFKSLQNEIDGEKNQVHTRSLHAEENAFLQLAKYGGSGIEGGKLFTTASPCELCAKKAYQLGIKEVVFIDPYPGIAIQHILHVGTNPPNLVQFRGAIGKAYQQLYEPLMPYKDELEFLITEL
ncbi:anti-phage dCTP deaminase [Acinetobacter seifertii]|uniref:anti-phage dCTP deaminase n=1 Tax=Acinetobacter seifertii TaxID=1530123 RepID=UPI00066740E0|nr:anti-phage dCTP deaminase [Acinetobacter seifertii]